MRQYEEEKMLIGSDNKFIAWNILFIMAGCANKDNEDKDDTKIEQNLDKKEDAEDFNKKMKKQMRIKRLKKMRMKTKIQGKPEFIMLMT